MPFIPLLTILFIGLKLTNYIDWSWWWVLAPMWIALAAAAVFFAIAGILHLSIMKSFNKRKPW